MVSKKNLIKKQTFKLLLLFFFRRTQRTQDIYSSFSSLSKLENPNTKTILKPEDPKALSVNYLISNSLFLKRPLTILP